MEPLDFLPDLTQPERDRPPIWRDAALAYDVLMRHRYLYYVECSPIWSDLKYDRAERSALARWPWLAVALGVGPDSESAYLPQAIRGGHPVEIEREWRDRILDAAWLEWLFSQD